MAFYGEVVSVEQYQGQLLIQWNFRSTHLVGDSVVDMANRFAMPIPTGTRVEIRNAIRARLQLEIEPQIDAANRGHDALPNIINSLVGFRYPPA